MSQTGNYKPHYDLDAETIIFLNKIVSENDLKLLKNDYYDSQQFLYGTIFYGLENDQCNCVVYASPKHKGYISIKVSIENLQTEASYSIEFIKINGFDACLGMLVQEILKIQ